MFNLLLRVFIQLQLWNFPWKCVAYVESLFKCVVTDKRCRAAGLQSRMILRVRTAFFWAITQRVVVISYRRFETTSVYHLRCFFFNSWTLRMGPTGCPETWLRNYNHSLRVINQKNAVLGHLAAEAWNDGYFECLVNCLKRLRREWVVASCEVLSLYLKLTKCLWRLALCSGRDMNLVPPEYDTVPLWRHGDCKLYFQVLLLFLPCFTRHHLFYAFHPYPRV